MTIAVYPGSFDPPTIAHLAVARAAVDQRGALRVDLAISRSTLGKAHLDERSLERRLERLGAVVDAHPWMGLVVVESALVVDIAEGYDLVVMGADKWHQVNDPVWYGGDPAERDRALARLPRAAVAPRSGHPAPPHLALDLPSELAEVSSSAVRQGRAEWAAPISPPAPGAG